MEKTKQKRQQDTHTQISCLGNKKTKTKQECNASTQKWKIMSSFTHPQVVSNLSFFCWTQRKIFWRMIGPLAPLTSIVFFFTMEVNGAKQSFKRKKGLKQLEGE